MSVSELKVIIETRVTEIVDDFCLEKLHKCVVFVTLYVRSCSYRIIN